MKRLQKRKNIHASVAAFGLPAACLCMFAACVCDFGTASKTSTLEGNTPAEAKMG